MDKIKICQLFSNDEYPNLLQYCTDCNLIFIDELQTVDYVAYKSEYGVKAENITDIKQKITEANQGFFYNIGLEREEAFAESLANGESYRPDILNVMNQPYYYSPIENLNLSVRSYNCLTKSGFDIIGKLLDVTEDELLKIKNLGQSSLDEIKEKINAVTQGSFVIKDHAKSTSKEADIFCGDDREIYLDIPIKELELSVRSYNCLFNSGITMASQLLKLTEKELFNIQFMGRKSVKEIMNKIKQISFVTKTDITLECCKVNFLENTKNQLVSAYKRINVRLLNCKIEPLLLAYTRDEIAINQLRTIIEHSVHIFELEQAIECCYQSSEAVPLLSFLKWLHIDIDEILNNFLVSQNKGKSIKVMSCRAAGGTLESAAQILGVTRERVRQIEKKCQSAFDALNTRSRILFFVSALSDNKQLLAEQDVKGAIQCEHINTIIYLLKNSDTQYCMYSEKLHCFVLGENNGFDQIINDLIQDAPELITKDGIYRMIEECADIAGIDSDLVFKIVVRSFRNYGKYYSKSKLSNTEMYNFALKNYFIHGYKIDDEIEVSRLRKYIAETFGDVNLPGNTHTIDARIMDIGILCDRGTYRSNHDTERYIDIVKKIDKFIDSSDRISLSFHEIFEVYKEELITSYGVNNRFHMQGILKYYLKSSYFFSRDGIAKDNKSGIVSEITEAVKVNGQITTAELRVRFSGITEGMLFQALSRCQEVINISDGVYEHISALNLIEQDNDMKEYLSLIVNETPVSTRKLIELYYIKYPDFLSRNNIYSYTKLFSVLKYMFSDKFKFSRPFIGKSDIAEITNIGMVRNYIKGRSAVEFDELIDYCNKNHINVFSWSNMIREIEDEFIRNDANELVSIEILDIDDGKIKTIKDSVLNAISHTGYISVRNIESFIFYPDINIRWTGYLLKAIVQKYIDDIIVVEAQTSDIFFLNGIFVKQELDIENYEQLLRWVIKSEHARCQFKDRNEIKEWLLEEKLINQVMPKFMLDNDYLYIDEYGKVVVQ